MEVLALIDFDSIIITHLLAQLFVYITALTVIINSPRFLLWLLKLTINFIQRHYYKSIFS